jgi:hypothetical protein
LREEGSLWLALSCKQLDPVVWIEDRWLEMILHPLFGTIGGLARRHHTGTVKEVGKAQQADGLAVSRSDRLKGLLRARRGDRDGGRLDGCPSLEKR